LSRTFPMPSDIPVLFEFRWDLRLRPHA
jgi:hypothetical protein